MYDFKLKLFKTVFAQTFGNAVMITNFEELDKF